MKMYAFTLEDVNKILTTLGEVPAKISFDAINILKTGKEVDITYTPENIAVPDAPAS